MTWPFVSRKQARLDLTWPGAHSKDPPRMVLSDLTADKASGTGVYVDGVKVRPC